MQVRASQPMPVSRVHTRSSSPQEAPQVPPSQQSPPWTRDELLTVSTNLASLGKELKPGEAIRVNVGGDKVVEVVKQGPDTWGAIKAITRDVVRTTGDVLNEDPSLAFRQAVEVGRRAFMGNHHPATVQNVMGALVPATRAVSLVLDLKRVRETLASPQSDLALKIVDVGHVATDVAGLVGTMNHLIPALNAVPGIATMAALGIVGDITAFGCHSLKYFQKAAAESTGQAQPPTPPPAPVSVHLYPPQG